MLKFSIAIFLILTILGIIFWREKASLQENLIAEHLSRNFELNFETSYTLKTSGFPNRTDTEVEELKISERNHRNEFKINRILVMSLIYNSDKYILSIDPPLQLRIDGNVLEIPMGTLDISISRKTRTSTLHGKNISAHFNGKDLLTIKDLILATRFIGETFPKHREIFIKIQDLYISRLENETIEEDKNIAFTFVLSKDLIESLDLNRMLSHWEKITRVKSTTKVTLEVFNTNLDIEKDLYALPSILRELLYSSQVFR